MAKKILNIATFGLAGALLGGKKDKKPAPVAETPAVMPIADDEAVQRARKNSIIKQMGRSGRKSTMLSADSETLGG